MCEELKPCPLCQKTESLDISYSEKTVKCMDCEIGCDIETWNTRALPPEVKALVNAAENLVTAIEELSPTPNATMALRRLGAARRQANVALVAVKKL